MVIFHGELLNNQRVIWGKNKCHKPSPRSPSIGGMVAIPNGWFMTLFLLTLCNIRITGKICIVINWEKGDKYGICKILRLGISMIGSARGCSAKHIWKQTC